jgi:hypothetical protein
MSIGMTCRIQLMYMQLSEPVQDPTNTADLLCPVSIIILGRTSVRSPIIRRSPTTMMMLWMAGLNCAIQLATMMIVVLVEMLLVI